jgi:hypothetical protein
VKDINNDGELSRLLDNLKDKDIKQLDTDFISWDEFQSLASIKYNIQSLLDQKKDSQGNSEIFNKYDNAYSQLVARASDYFYERGFADCLHILGRAMEKKGMEYSL